mmetsp:Transcript_26039/g.31604  ORF Transcript_26039/g.31604 Transcript_26039/m.31604 type:complete len:294 (-) Transcript_26039:512-1393(-)|eukprot:CAMPEP_0197853374 /NCGR_PEP_ID=MMETSP1438-20131217/22598_1 /TAXON_ID=1461541 /ORGANISM="Pterosperma sp., Strain CCMP1384" /LENGTH=293 /DNA_ID=CAMNT_0043467761 /DNA_START=144 /DNA_END=1025 /DNA_ORIENTATION=+
MVYWNENRPRSAASYAAIALVQADKDRRNKAVLDEEFKKANSPENKDTPTKQTQSLKEREKEAKAEYQAHAKQEMKNLWLYKEGNRKEVQQYFSCLQDPNWKLLRNNNDLEVWKLPGEEIHRIMGVTNVECSPQTCLDHFDDTENVFKTLFPQIDKMFRTGSILKQFAKGHTICQACFDMPSPIGGGAAKGIAARDMVWEQRVTKLQSGNVLVTASTPDNHTEVPVTKGMVRGSLITSGYYGRKLNEKNHSRCWYIIQADPKGMLPKWLVNLASAKQTDNLIRLREMFRGVNK